MIPAACAAGPCYGMWDTNRTNFFMMLGTGIVTASAVRLTYINPVTGAAVRIFASVRGIGFLGGSGMVGWATYHTYRAGRQQLDKCVADNGWFYHISVIH